MRIQLHGTLTKCWVHHFSVPPFWRDTAQTYWRHATVRQPRTCSSRISSTTSVSTQATRVSSAVVRSTLSSSGWCGRCIAIYTFSTSEHKLSKLITCHGGLSPGPDQGMYFALPFKGLNLTTFSAVPSISDPKTSLNCYGVYRSWNICYR